MDDWRNLPVLDNATNLFERKERTNKNKINAQGEKSDRFVPRPRSTWYKIELWNKKKNFFENQHSLNENSFTEVLPCFDSLKYENISSLSLSGKQYQKQTSKIRRLDPTYENSLGILTLLPAQTFTIDNHSAGHISHSSENHHAQATMKLKESDSNAMKLSNFVNTDCFTCPVNVSDADGCKDDSFEHQKVADVLTSKPIKDYYSPRRSRDSVTSDPEIYTKSVTCSQKLNSQIKMLKTEMLTLRSNTREFQQIMEKAFEELMLIKQLHQNDNIPWQDNALEIRELPNQTEESNFESSRKERNKAEENFSHPTTCSRDYYRLESVIAPNYENIDQSCDFKIEKVTNCPDNQEYKPPAGSNKDCLKKINEASFIATEHLYGDKRNKSNFVPRFRDIKNNSHNSGLTQRIPEAIKKLHLSKSSIDSGYQDSSAPSPPKKSEHRVTPKPNSLTPTCASPEDLCNYQTVPKTSYQVPFTSTIPNVYVKHTANKKASKLKEINNTLLNTSLSSANRNKNIEIYQQNDGRSDSDNRTKVESKQDSKVESLLEKITRQSQSQKEKPVKLNGNHDTNADLNLAFVYNHKSLLRSETEVRDAVIRPIPKQRHVVSSCQTVYMSNKYTSKDQPNLEPHKQLACVSPSTEQDSLLKNVQKSQDRPKHVETNQFGNKCVTEPQREFLTIVKSKSENVRDSSEMIREEHCVTKKEYIIKKDADSSLIRRRSMRLMQEFQLFDFEELVVEVDNEVSNASEFRAVEVSKNNPSLSNSVSPCVTTSSYVVSPPVASKIKNCLLDQNSDVEVNFATKSANTYASQLRKEETNAYQHYENVKWFSKIDNANSEVLSVSEDRSAFTNFEPILKSNQEQCTQFHKSELDLFIPPLIRPKPALCNGETFKEKLVKSTCNGLKLNPNSKSAFKPVVGVKSAATFRQFSHGSTSSKDKEDLLSIQLKRSSSLPTYVCSNKNKYRREISLNQPQNESDNNDYNSQKKVHCHNKENSQSVLSNKSPPITRIKTNGLNQKKIIPTITKFNSAKMGDVSIASPGHSSVLNKRNQFEDVLLENGKRKKHDWPTSRILQQRSSSNKNFELISTTTSVTSSKKDENTISLSRARKLNENNFTREATLPCTPKSSSLSFSNSKKVSVSPHQYETVKPAKERVDEDCAAGRNEDDLFASKFLTGNQDPSATERKSTFGLFKANFFTKKNSHQRNNSVDAKVKHISSEKSEKRIPKNSNNQKQNRFSIVRRFSKKNGKEAANNIKEQHYKKALLPPDNEEPRYGNADSEMMQKFLEAAVASHSHPPQSPLQRIQRSFRVVKNKSSSSLKNKAKDDSDIRETLSLPRQNSRKKSNIHNGLEFTYV